MIMQPELKKPRFYKEPSESDIESMGMLAAEIKARTRARIIGGRVMSLATAATVGGALTITDSLSGGRLSVPEITTNFLIPVAVQWAAQLKTSHQLRHMGEELIRILPEIGQPTAEENSI